MWVRKGIIRSEEEKVAYSKHRRDFTNEDETFDKILSFSLFSCVLHSF
jgi:hypothetical protein